MESQNSSKKIIGIVIGIVVLVGVTTVSILGFKNNTQVATEQSSDVITQNPATDPKLVAVVYKDGTYIATGSYMSPGGKDTISVELTLIDSRISSISLTPITADDTSREYIGKFTSGYKQYVIGKNIADVKLSKVSGSSLTSVGFNNALSTIKAQAKV